MDDNVEADHLDAFLTDEYLAKWAARKDSLSPVDISTNF